MAFAIVLTLDPASAAPVRALWQRLAKAGMRVMADLGVDPHLSLAVWEALDVERAAAAVTALAGETAPVAVTFTEVRAFGGEAVYLWPAPSPRLAELQARVQARLAPLGVGASAHYAAAAW
ncbi:MAG TPA: 2'-5' RNA ligase family protein, partial [Methylomirabilota bacterium]|nr:2'-5' RNA ligase family protein [Methylomirabilota bacterium]